MPKLDKTGPRGQGPRTGQGMGICPPGYGDFGGFGRGFGFGRGWGRGLGFGRCWGFPFAWPSYEPNPKEEKEMLNEELKIIKEETKEIEKRLEQLKGQK